MVTRDPLTMSAAWLREQQRLTSRIEFHGPSITWPIVKDEGSGLRVRTDREWASRSVGRAGSGEIPASPRTET